MEQVWAVSWDAGMRPLVVTSIWGHACALHFFFCVCTNLAKRLLSTDVEGKTGKTVLCSCWCQASHSHADANLKVDPCSLQNSGSGKNQRGATFIHTIRRMRHMHRSFVKLLAQVSSIQLDTAAAEVFGPWVVNNLGIMDLILRETDLPGEAEGSHRDSRRKPFNGYSSCKVWRSRFLRDSKSKLSKLSKLKWTSGPVAQWPWTPPKDSTVWDPRRRFEDTVLVRGVGPETWAAKSKTRNT